jgi:hypothetical protein
MLVYKEEKGYVYVNIEQNFEGRRMGFDILKRFNIGIVTINRYVMIVEHLL